MVSDVYTRRTIARRLLWPVCVAETWLTEVVKLRLAAIGNLKFAGLYEAQRFDLRFFRPFRADLSIRKSSSFLPPLIAATSQRGFAPRPAQVSPDGP